MPRCPLVAEGVEEVGADRFCATIVLVGWAVSPPPNWAPITTASRTGRTRLGKVGHRHMACHQAAKPIRPQPRWCGQRESGMPLNPMRGLAASRRSHHPQLKMAILTPLMGVGEGFGNGVAVHGGSLVEIL